MTSSFRRVVSLKNSAAFQSILHNRETLRLRSQFVDVFIRRSVISYHLGLIVSKRCYKRAVDRNRIKRLFREYVRLNVRKHEPMHLIIRLKLPFDTPPTLASITVILDNLLRRAFPST